MSIKDLPHNGPCIYQLTNIITGKVYIGSAQKVRNRMGLHLRELKKGNHHSRKLQNSWNKHGEGAFRSEILAECPIEYLLKLEQWFIDTKQPHIYGYNMCSDTRTVRGFKHTQETRVKMSKAKKGVKFTPEHLANMFQARWVNGCPARTRVYKVTSLSTGEVNILTGIDTVREFTGLKQKLYIYRIVKSATKSTKNYRIEVV